MALEYGVLRARPDLAKREDGASTPHLQIRALDATGQPWRVAVNVQSDDDSEVVFWVVDRSSAIRSWERSPPCHLASQLQRPIPRNRWTTSRLRSSTSRWAEHCHPVVAPTPTICRIC